ncbi:flagellar basal body-associated FliL family protein [Pseudomonadales bacterium]|nr:flagellar basal body-associated FliL family protein [Pseudomonadales bacterium]MDC1299410.1 flagellar basal body-associated FliL family protein [Pseudomonadales bacterium]
MNKIVVIVLVAVISVGVTLGGAFMMGAFDQSASNGAATPAADDRAFVYVEIPPVVANFQLQGVMRYAQVTISIQTRDPNSEVILKENTPLIVNKVLLLLGDFDYGILSTLEGKEQLVADIAEAIRGIFSQTATPVTFEQVILTGFVVQ